MSRTHEIVPYLMVVLLDDLLLKSYTTNDCFKFVAGLLG